jgi:hypothetical protein
VIGCLVLRLHSHSIVFVFVLLLVERPSAGWFGKGIYFSTSPAYALRYCGKPKVLLMCYVVLLNPFPLLQSDAPDNVDEKHFRFFAAGLR